MANLVDELLKADAKTADELATSTVASKRLAKILGKKGTVDVVIQEIPARRINDIVSFQFDKKGNFDVSKSFDAKALCCVEGVIEPSLKDEGLIKHFGCATPKDLAVKLFGAELTKISDAISILSGVDADTEDEVKN